MKRSKREERWLETAALAMVGVRLALSVVAYVRLLANRRRKRSGVSLTKSPPNAPGPRMAS